MRPTLAVLCLALSTFSALAAAKAKPGRYSAASETVLDSTTKLTWQRNVVAQTYKWQDAKDYCKALVLAGGGWRLPAVRELRSIVDFGQNNPSIDKAAFPNTPSDYFWSATAYSGSVSTAWIVYFTVGNSYTDVISGPHRVRCVR